MSDEIALGEPDRVEDLEANIKHTSRGVIVAEGSKALVMEALENKIVADGNSH